MYQAELIFENELSPKTGTKIPQGIHTNCSVVSIEQGDTGKNTYTDINFSDSEGRYHNLRLWGPTGNYPNVDKGETKQDAIEREEKLNLSHLVKLVHIFLGRDGLTGISGEYKEMMDKLVAKLTKQVLASKKVNLKLIYNSAGLYSEFGKYPDYIEEYVEGQEPKLFFTPYELANRCTLKEQPKPQASAAAYDINKIL